MSTPATRCEPDGAPSTRRAEDTTRREPVPGDSTRRESADTSNATRRLQLPEAITSRYHYVGDLASSGGEADLVLLQDLATGEEVVLKFYRPGIAPDGAAIELLSTAAEDHVVRLVEFHNEANGVWEIQEYYPAGSLGNWVAERGGCLKADVLGTVVREISDALAHLHDVAGVAHRDLKPANVLVRREDPLDLVLADFGLATAQQDFTHLTTTAKGTWHYAAPEVHRRESTRKSDWFSLGVMVFEFHTGRKLFSLADGSEVSEDDARRRSMSGDYSTGAIADPRFRLLVDGLLTQDKDHRWGQAQVSAWLRGESPAVHRAAPPPQERISYRPPWSPNLVHTPRELVAEMRRFWDEVSDALVGRPDVAMVSFLKSFPSTEHAVNVLSSGESPGAKLVRLQVLLDPTGAVQFSGAELDDQTLARRIQRASEGDEPALNWLEALVEENILTALAEVTRSTKAARADYLLGQWQQQAKTTSSGLPDDVRSLANQAFRMALPQLVATALASDAP